MQFAERASKLLLIASFFAVVGLDQASAQDAGWGNLKGRIKVVGDLPEIARETVDKDQATCLAGKKESPLDDNLIVDKDGGLKDAFVMMYIKDKKPAIHPSYVEAAKKPKVLDNKQCRFEPHATFLQTGQPLMLKNSDDVGHNCHITLLNGEENVTIPIGEAIEVKFDETEKVPGIVACDIHRWMDAVLLVRDEPYVAITDSKGNFEIKNIPAGEWKFQFWHKKSAYMRALDVPGKKVGRRGEIEIAIEDGKTLDLGEMTLDGSKLNK